MRQYVLELPEEVVEQVETEARLAHRSTESLLSERLLSELRRGPSIDSVDLTRLDLSGFPDALLEAHIRTPLPKSFSDRLSVLQERNARRTITDQEKAELEEMMTVYHSSTILKALALVAWKKRHGALPAQIQADFDSQ